VDGTPDQGEQALSVLRGIWTANAQSVVDIDESRGKVCKNTAKLGFHVGDDEEGQEIRAAWKEQLAREGKLSDQAPSIRELLLGGAESEYRS
jgi:hypothetical protein